MQEKKEKRGGVRQNAGRKSTISNPVRITVDVPLDHVLQLDELAKQQERSRSDLIREAIKNVLKKGDSCF